MSPPKIAPKPQQSHSHVLLVGTADALGKVPVAPMVAAEGGIDDGHLRRLVHAWFLNEEAGGGAGAQELFKSFNTNLNHQEAGCFF